MEDPAEPLVVLAGGSCRSGGNVKAVRLVRAGWWDDEVNGDPGRPLYLDDAKAESHVAAGNAVYDAKLQAELDSTPRVLDRVELVEVSADYASPYGEPEATFVGQEAAARRLEALTEALSGEPETAEAPAELKMPWSNASKATWIDWAVHCGADPAEAAEQTKNQLMSRYGERL